MDPGCQPYDALYYFGAGNRRRLPCNGPPCILGLLRMEIYTQSALKRRVKNLSRFHRLLNSTCAANAYLLLMMCLLQVKALVWPIIFVRKSKEKFLESGFY